MDSIFACAPRRAVILTLAGISYLRLPNAEGQANQIGSWLLTPVIFQLLLVFISFFTPAAEAATTNYQITLESNNYAAPYNYCVGVQNAIVDVAVLDATSGTQLGFFGLVTFSNLKPAQIPFSSPDTVSIRVLVTPRQSEYGLGLPTDPVSCDPNHRVDVPLAIAGGLMRIDPDGFVRSTSIGIAFSGYSGMSTDAPGQPTEIPALALVYDAACESAVTCTGKKISSVGGHGYVTPAGATDTSGIVPRHGVIADGISTLLIKFPASAGPIGFNSIDDQGGPFLASGSTAFGMLGTSPNIPVTSLLPCPLGQLYLIGSQTEQCAPFTTLSVVPTLQNVVAYQAPVDFPDETVLSRGNIALVGPVGEIREVDLQFYGAGGLQGRTWYVGIDLARPPVVLIHGLWSNSSTWSNFVGNSSSDGNYDLSRRLSLALPNYESDLWASNTFSPLSKPVSVGIVEQAINNEALAAERAAGFAASAVDAVGHSLGGLQVRSLAAGGGRLAYARADNYFAGSVHKLVTIGTPHFGAPIAREIMKNRCESSSLLQSLTTFDFDTSFDAGFSETPPQPVTTFQEYMDSWGAGIGLDYFGPALEDFQPGSKALSALSATAIPTHVIGSTAPTTNFAFSLVDFAATALFGIDLDVPTALAAPTDGVVPLSSQLSGFSTGDSAVTVLTGPLHTQETGDAGAYTAIDQSLRAGTFPSNSLRGAFATGLPSSVGDGAANYTFDACPPATSAGASTKTIHVETRSNSAASTAAPVLTPASGTMVSVGQLVTLNAQLQGATSGQFVFNNSVIAGTGAAGSFSATIQVPQGGLGRLPFSVLLNDGQGNLTQLNSYLVVSADLTGAVIAVTPQSVSLAHVGDSAQILATATMPNGTVFPFDSSVQGVSYNLTSSGNSRNAVLMKGSTVLATRNGVGSLSISAAGSTVTIPVAVLSNGFANQATSSLAVVYKNIADPRILTFTVPLPGDLTASDINLNQIALAGASAAVPVTWGTVQQTDRQLTFQTKAVVIATAFPVGATSLLLAGLAQDGSVWTSTTSVQVSSTGAIVPDLVGGTQATASATLASSGLSVGTVSQVNSACANIGVILSETPQAGSVVDVSTPISLATSSGVVVPNAVSITQAMASTAITSAGLTVGTVTQQSSSSVPSGSVISQSPVAGTNVNPASSVDLTVSSGPPPAGKGGGGALDGWVLFTLLGLALTQRRRFVPDQH